jgi:hypothetical protein
MVAPFACPFRPLSARSIQPSPRNPAGIVLRDFKPPFTAWNPERFRYLGTVAARWGQHPLTPNRLANPPNLSPMRGPFRGPKGSPPTGGAIIFLSPYSSSVKHAIPPHEETGQAGGWNWNCARRGQFTSGNKIVRLSGRTFSRSHGNGRYQFKRLQPQGVKGQGQ